MLLPLYPDPCKNKLIKTIEIRRYLRFFVVIAHLYKKKDIQQAWRAESCLSLLEFFRSLTEKLTTIFI